MSHLSSGFHLTQQYLAFRQSLVAHPGWILLLIFLLAALEGVAVLGAVIPGVALVFALSVMAGAADIDPAEVVGFGVLGALMGDGFSYLLGRRFKHRVERVWPFRAHLHWLEASEAFVERHGGKSLILGRFIGPLRAFVPMATGIFEMPARRYMLFSSLSALAWAPVHILPGYAIGAAAGGPIVPGQPQLLLVAALLLLVAVLAWLLPMVRDAFLDRRQHRRIAKSVADSVREDALDERQLALAYSALALMGFAILALCRSWLTVWDQRVAMDMVALRIPALDDVFQAFSMLGEPLALGLLAMMILLWLVGRRDWQGVICLIMAAIACTVPAVLKPLFLVARPQVLLHVPVTYAFPSSHATSAVLAWGFCYFFLVRHLGREWRPWILAMALALILFTATSRLYFGAHWLSDVLGGLSLGAGLLGLVRWQWLRATNMPICSTWESGLVLLTAIGASCMLVVLPAWSQATSAYQPRPLPTAPNPHAADSRQAKSHHHKLIVPHLRRLLHLGKQ